MCDSVKDSECLCACPENLCETEFKSSGLVCLTEGILGHYSIQAVPYLLIIAPLQVYSEKEQQVGSKI